MANYEEANIFVEKLKKLKKNITVYAYKNKKDEQDYSKTLYRIITSKETDNLFNNKMNEIVGELEEKNFDAVIDLTTQRNFPLEYLLARAHASIKAGLKKNDFPQYDLAISALPDIENESLKVRELAKQIVFYLHTIRPREIEPEIDNFKTAHSVAVPNKILQKKGHNLVPHKNRPKDLFQDI
jgi:hypothetical protein